MYSLYDLFSFIRGSGCGDCGLWGREPVCVHRSCRGVEHIAEVCSTHGMTTHKGPGTCVQCTHLEAVVGCQTPQALSLEEGSPTTAGWGLQGLCISNDWAGLGPGERYRQGLL